MKLDGIPSSSMEDSDAECDLNCGAQKVSEQKNFSMRLRLCCCDILVKNMTILCL